MPAVAPQALSNTMGPNHLLAHQREQNLSARPQLLVEGGLLVLLWAVKVRVGNDD